MKIIKFPSGVLVIILLAIFNSCTCHREERIPLDSIDVTIEVKRFDQDLFSIVLDSIEKEVGRLDSVYGEFFALFTEGIIGIGLPDNPSFNNYLSSFVTDNMVSETYRKVQSIFPDEKQLNRTLTDAFKRYRYYFPNKQIPDVYGFVSGFNNSIMLAEGIIGVGFDRYLGSDCEYYSLLGIPKYLQYSMRPEKIPSDLVRFWLFGEFQFNDSIDNLLNNMIYEGMLMYLTKRLLPEQPDSLIFGFTPDQMQWCNRNEEQMWAHLVEHKLLFSTEQFTINQFVGEAPFTKAFTNESPGKASIWLGYRIVSRFMNRNKDYSLSMLMNETDYLSILSRSGYNP
jgi:hypothetical protein